MVCEGEQLELNCSTNVSILRWTSSPLQNEQGQVQTFMRFISSVGTSQQVSTMTVNSTLFNVSRVSSQNESPLMSRLVINPVSNGLNGTRVNCTERTMNNENTAMTSTTIYIIDLHTRKLNTAVNQNHFIVNYYSYSPTNQYLSGAV